MSISYSPARSVAGSVRSRSSRVSHRSSASRTSRTSKFAHVKSVVRTGQSSKRSVGLTTGEVLRRRDEIFSRVGAKALESLLADAAPAPESLYDLVETRSAPVVVVDATEDPSQRQAFVLLDCRSEEQFEACHIHGAVHFDSMLLRQDRVPGAYYGLKGAQRERQLILYSDGDRRAAQAAKAFVEKGWSCAAILSGGLTRFAKHHGHLIEGDAAEDVLAELDFNASGSPIGGGSRSRRRRGGGGGDGGGSSRGSSRGGGSSARSVSSSRSSRRGGSRR